MKKPTQKELIEDSHKKLASHYYKWSLLLLDYRNHLYKKGEKLKPKDKRELERNPEYYHEILKRMINEDYTLSDAIEICALKQVKFDNWHASNTKGNYIAFNADFVELERDNQDFLGNRAVIVKLNDYLNIKSDYENLVEGMLIVVKAGNEKVALFIDEFLHQHQVVVKPLDKNFRSVEGVGAATVRGDGSIGLILDIMGIIEVQKKTEKQNDGLTLLKGEFIYFADAAVLQTHREVYGVVIDEKMHELDKQVQQ